MANTLYARMPKMPFQIKIPSYRLIEKYYKEITMHCKIKEVLSVSDGYVISLECLWEDFSKILTSVAKIENEIKTSNDKVKEYFK